MPRERQDDDLPANDDEIDREAQENRERLDSIPEPGTDPLHEGP